jgi:hypothetical protein
MTLPLVLFALAAVGGVVMAIQRFSGKPQPAFGLAIVHGLAAAAGLITLIIAISNAGDAADGGGNSATIALVLFLIAAVGGFVLFFQHLRKNPLPIPILVIHAIVAVVAFLILLIGTMT